MHRSSESVAALACALAKAQAELINPEKSLTATIRTGPLGERERTFRYAPLSSGLDIVRKTLGQHEIATVQTTAIDQTAGTVNLTTMLAHASGEWIASDWPICPIAEMASPQRMGAALTYARRYALFTLVGIAGEDDLDAPDLCDGPLSATASPVGGGPSHPKPGISPRMPGNGRARGSLNREQSVTLDPDQSAALREKLLTEVGSITSAERATTWAREALNAKNRLIAADAKRVEEVFEQRLSDYPLTDTEAAPEGDLRGTQAVAGEEAVAHARVDTSTNGIDKSVLTVAAPRRYRHREHLRSVAKQPCLICGRKPSDPHHLRYLQPRALGRKASDRAVHGARDERAWWRAAGIDPSQVAGKLWSVEGRIEAGRRPAAAVPDRSSDPGGALETPAPA